MNKKGKNKSVLGRALINDRFGKNKGRRTKDHSILHSSEVPDGYEWSRLNLQSVTEESSFQEFLSTAQLAGTEYQTEKLNITFVNPFVGSGLLTKQEKQKASEAQEQNKHFLAIPRRPKWDEKTTREQLEAAENEEFLEWRRRLATLQEEEQLILTPYEKNLEFWRQLWRVVERSDVVVQIVDARNPLLFRCEDLENYVREMSPHKQNLILLNKADYLTRTQRKIWATYFEQHGVRAAFYSATAALEDEESEEETGDEHLVKESLNKLNLNSTEDGKCDADPKASGSKERLEEEEEEDILNEIESSDDEGEDVEDDGDCADDVVSLETPPVSQSGESSHSELNSPVPLDSTSNELSVHINKKSCKINSSKLLSRSELIALFYSMHSGEKVSSGITTIGMVGYPNVGKSSTINSLLLEKRVSVSATPGKTKHFQTLYLDKDLMLCDCPGLVMPSFMFSKADMVINGVLSIDQMRDHVPPVNLVASLIPRHVLEDTYGLMIPPPREGEDPKRAPTSEELLNAFGCNRGFMTQNGQPDNPRSARHVLKDFVNGKLLYCYAPPGYNQDEFHTFPERRRRIINQTEPVKRSLKANTSSALDEAFFRRQVSGVHVKGYAPSAHVENNVGKKPWKDHSAKRNKREKLRRVYVHLDQH